MVLISPYSAALPNGNRNPKNYPFWRELIPMIDAPLVQVGIDGEEQLVRDFRKNLSTPDLRQLIRECHTWIGCDSFFQHLAWDEGKKGIVLWSVSDPLIFGHPENINLLKSREQLGPQFLWWTFVEHKSELFVTPDIVAKCLSQNFGVLLNS